MQKLFAKYGTIVNFEWISKEGSKMALIEMSTLKEAVLSLIVSFFFCFLIIFEYKKSGFIHLNEFLCRHNILRKFEIFEILRESLLKNKTFINLF